MGSDMHQYSQKQGQVWSMKHPHFEAALCSGILPRFQCSALITSDVKVGHTWPAAFSSLVLPGNRAPNSRPALLWASKACLHLCFAPSCAWTSEFQGLVRSNFPCDVLHSLWKQKTQVLMSSCRPIQKLEKTLLLNTDFTMLVNSSYRWAVLSKVTNMSSKLKLWRWQSYRNWIATGVEPASWYGG